MKLTPKVLQKLEHDLEHCQTAQDLMGKNGVIKNLNKGLSEPILDAELTHYLGYEKYDPKSKLILANCNWTFPATAKGHLNQS